MAKDSGGNHGSIQVSRTMRLYSGDIFTEKRFSPAVRFLFRSGITLLGFILWILLRELLSYVFSFIENGILNYAVTGFIALAVLFPLWKPVPWIAGRFGRKNAFPVAASAGAWILPFAVIAFFVGLQYAGITLEWLIFAMALLFLAATEEVLFRGFMMDTLSFRGSRITGLLISSLLFAMLHLGNDFTSFAGIANIFLAGAMFGLLRLVTDGLFYPILLHWFWNFITGMVFGWNVSGNSVLPSVFRPLNHQPWGGFGPEESILMTIGTLGAITILIKKLRLMDDDKLSRSTLHSDPASYTK